MLANGTVDCGDAGSEAAVGTQCNVTCADGITGNTDVITCTAAGVFDIDPICSRKL